MRLVWITDPHLNFLNTQELNEFIESVRVVQPDALAITGDIAEAPNVRTYLMLLETRLGVPVYFVFGNHDFYNGSIAEVRKWGKEITHGKHKLFWMPAEGVVELTSTTALVGVDGWGDGHFGKPNDSNVFLHDWMAIRELLLPRCQSRDTHISYRVPMLNRLGEEEASSLRPQLEQALLQYEHVYIITHVPPWKESTWHQGKHSDDDWLPWFSCKAVGEVIVELAEKFPDKKVTVLCGHTHGRGVSHIRDNVVAYTGGAKYHYPEIQMVLEI